MKPIVVFDDQHPDFGLPLNQRHLQTYQGITILSAAAFLQSLHDSV